MESRTCLSELPNILICHLKRIVFDFDTFETIKINTRFQFPQVCGRVAVCVFVSHRLTL